MLSLEAISFFLALVAISQASLLIDIGKTGQVYNAAGTDDGFTAAVFPISTLPFFERNVTSIYMGMNGVITINGTMNQQQSFNLKGWPRLDGSISYLAPLWADTNGFHIGAMRCSESQDPVLLRQARDVVLNANPGLFGFNAEFMFVGNWVDVTPCGCFFPRNTFQVVWVTDGCTAFAIYSYEKVGWGVDENARIGVVNHLDQIHNEHTSSSNRNFAGLTGNNIVMSLGGENICTGRSAGETVIDSDGVPHICGHCKPSDRVPPVNGGYTTWSAWSACSRTCGDGIHTKTRNCSNPIPQHGGLNCLQQGLGPETITESCKVRECPINGGFTQWTAWSACSQTCGNGFHTKRRFCTNPSPQHGGLSCQFQNLGPDTITEACKDRECPIDGGYTTWSAWGACSQTCGNGFHTKTRTCTNPQPQFNGLSCFQQNLGPESLTEVCKDRECPINGGYTTWSAWGACSQTCGNGFHTKTRTCTNPQPQFNGLSCFQQNLGPESLTEACKDRECPIDGGYTEWSSWSACSATCGDGTHLKTRTCTNPPPQFNGLSCFQQNLGPEILQEACKDRECPVDGIYTQWSQWGACSVTCGTGTHIRNRQCIGPFHGGRPCTDPLNKNGFGDATESENCFERACPSCKGQLDVGMIIDSSGSVSMANYMKQKTFVKKLNTYLRTNSEPNSYISGVIQFSELAEIVHYLGNSSAMFDSHVDNMGYMGTVTRLDKALKKADNELFRDFNGDRLNVKNLVFIVIDGTPTKDHDWEDPVDITDRFRAAGMDVMVLGIGSEISLFELNELAGNLPNRVLKTPSFDNFDTDSFVTEAGKLICGSNAVSDPDCVGKGDGDYRVDDTCKSYYRCISEQKTLLSCPANQYFNTVTRVCENDVPSNCRHPDCIGKSTAFYTVDDSCSAHYRCENDFRVSSGTCTSGTYFNVASGVCENTPPIGCHHPDCLGKGDGDYRVDDTCKSYYRCTSEEKTLLSCPANQYFNTVTRVCENDVPTNCKHPDCIGKATGSYIDDPTCNSFYVCDRNFRSMSDSCDPGRFFNNVTNLCQDDPPPGCQYPFCLTNGDGNYFDTDVCSSGFTCAGGFRNNPVTCLSGTYYNTVTGLCESSVPSNCAGVDINGGYTTWTEWVPCSVTCGSSDAVHTRTRTCTNPAPLNNGLNCIQQGLGVETETRPCGRDSCADQCTGKADYDRVPHENDCTKYYECQSQLPAERSCPNNFNFVGHPNGVFFHPYYKTCVNTTTNSCPTHMPVKADFSDACIEIADYQNNPAGLNEAKLPDPNNCRKWITCKNQVYTPSAFQECTARPYNADAKFCDSNFNCFFPYL